MPSFHFWVTKDGREFPTLQVDKMWHFCYFSRTFLTAWKLLFDTMAWCDKSHALTRWQPVFDSHAVTTYPIWTEVCSRVLTRSRGWSSRVDMEPLRAPARNDLVTGDWSRKKTECSSVKLEEPQQRCKLAWI